MNPRMIFKSALGQTFTRKHQATAQERDDISLDSWRSMLGIHNDAREKILRSLAADCPEYILSKYRSCIEGLWEVDTVARLAAAGPKIFPLRNLCNRGYFC
jgi:hypothetical protein